MTKSKQRTEETKNESKYYYDRTKHIPAKREFFILPMLYEQRLVEIKRKSPDKERIKTLSDLITEMENKKKQETKQSRSEALIYEFKQLILFEYNRFSEHIEQIKKKIKHKVDDVKRKINKKIKESICQLTLTMQ